jgi:CheY-like chemotaxis protein
MQVRDLLPKGNFEVLEARDGVEGLDVIHRELPNLVLLDFFMPRMNGWEVVQQIQTDTRLKTIPIVMMSGRREDVEKTVPELFNYFEVVGKPFEPAHLFRAIKAATAKAKDRQDLKPPEPVAETDRWRSATPVAAEVMTATLSMRGDRPQSFPMSAERGDEWRSLKAEVQQLRIQNVKLQQEVEGLKKQMLQVVNFVRQRLK